MPLYEYKCKSCNKTQDVRHGFKEEFEGKCEACGGDMARVFSATGIVFKGSGFYLTDSRKAEAASPSGGSSSASSTPATGSDSSASSAPAAPAAAPAAPAPKSESAA